MLSAFRAFLEALDTPGGHLFLLVVVCSGGAGLNALKIPHGDEILHDGFIALIAILSGRRSNINAQPDSNVQVNQSPLEGKQENKS